MNKQKLRPLFTVGDLTVMLNLRIKMIYTLTLNPCLDYVMDCEKVLYGETNRSMSESITFGGKGINVSVVLKELGVPSTALGLVGGFTGDELEKQIREMGIVSDFVHVCGGNTRINVKLRGKDITEINASGFSVTDDDLQKLYDKLQGLSHEDTLVIGGSAPKGSPDSIYEHICSLVSQKGTRLVVDTTGQKLLNCLKYSPFLIKPNKAELSELAGEQISSDNDVINGAKKLQNMGAVNVLVSMGSEGALLLDEDGFVHKETAHKITAVNTVGAGDSMVAGFLAGINDGYDNALKLGNACGAATAQSPCLAKYSDIKKFAV